MKIGEVRRGSAEVPGFSARSSAGASPLPTVEATVAAFVQAHRLTPSFPFQVITSLDGRGVIYVRQFPGPSGQAPEVGHDGALTGLRVSVESGAITVEGPLDLPLDAAEYPARAAADALSGLGLANPGAATGGEIVLDTARLVYLAIPAAGEGFYEPMLLLSGSGTGVLAPLIAPDQLRS